MRASFLSLFVGSLALVACGSSSASSAFTPSPDAGTPGGDDGSNIDAGGGGCLTCGDASFFFGDAAPAVGQTLLYAHDSTTLYQIDPTDPTLSITSVGTFDCIGKNAVASSMTDIALNAIALNAKATLYGLATSTVFLDMSIVPGGVSCTTGATALQAGSLGANASFYGASFAPAGTVAATETLIIGNDEGQMYAVDATTGALTIVGTFGTVPANDGNGHTYPSGKNGGKAGSTFQMSGDIVFLSNGSSPVGFATVRDCTSSSSCSATDTLVELDVSKLALNNSGSVVKAVRGQIVKAASCNDANNTSYGSMYGIAAYQSKVIGFSNQGFIVSISNVDGTACLIHDYSGSPTMIRFDGAGVTTSAPVTPPPPK